MIDPETADAIATGPAQLRRMLKFGAIDEADMNDLGLGHAAPPESGHQADVGPGSGIPVFNIAPWRYG